MDKIYIALSLIILTGMLICIVIIIKKKNSLYDAMRGMVEDDNCSVFCFGPQGRCLFANAKACELFQVNSRSEYGKIEEFYRKWLEESGRRNGETECWEQIYSVDGEERHFSVKFRHVKDRHGRTTGYIYTLTDTTDEIRRFREEQYLATHDKLTGMYNSEYFFQKAEELLKNDPDTERYMICTNIKNLKLVNDLFGEEVGDRILRAQAKQLKYADYDSCIHGRISGDKFAMLIPKENFSAELAEKNTAKLQYLIDNSNYKLQINIGVYRITDPTENPRVMFDRANMAISAQEGDYRKTVVYYDISMMEQLLHEKSVIDEFEYAIENRQFDMFLQPQVAADGRLLGAEALVRWRHPEKGLVFPTNFINVIEKTGLIIRLDRYMWELAAQRLKVWKDKGRDELCISVNISAKDFYYADLYRIFTELVEKYEIKPQNLNLEITETALMSDVEQHLETLGRLQEYGFRVEIDDFGSGYSSLNMLKDISADVLKIDMLFLRETENKERSRTILNSIISMSKALGMEVITEGVETEEQLALLKEMGCDVFQGYYFSKPIPVEEFENKYFGESEKQEISDGRRF